MVDKQYIISEKPKYIFKGQSVNGDWYEGLLSVSQGLSRQPEEGYYISNSGGMPWAYQVRPETVSLIKQPIESNPDMVKVIVEVLEECVDDYYKENHPLETIATNLLAKLQAEVICEGRVTQDLPHLDIWFINGKQINGLFKKYLGGDIRISVMKKEVNDD